MDYRKTIIIVCFVIIVVILGANKISSQPVVVSSIGSLLLDMKPQNIILIDGGREKVVSSVAETVGELLSEQKVVIGAQDIVIPAAYKRLDGLKKISIIRVKRSVYQEVVEIPAGERRIPDASLYIGEKKELVEGINGSETRQIEVILADSKPVSERVVKVTRSVKPQDRIVTFGTCNTIKVGVEDVKISQALEVEATAYTAEYESTGKTPNHPDYGITASGLPVEVGHIAVDPRVIPMHSKVYIVGTDKISREYTGYYTATDIGGAIKGNKIDIYMVGYNETYRFGRRKMKLYIIKAE